MTLEKIKEVVEKYSQHDIAENTRQQHIVFYRAVYFKLAKELTGNSLSKIGKEVNRDHATVLHGLRIFDEIVNKEYDNHYGKLFYKCYDELTEYEFRVEYEEQSKEDLIVNLKNEVKNLEYTIEDIKIKNKYKLFNELLELDDTQIETFYETRFKPFKRSLEWKN